MDFSMYLKIIHDLAVILKIHIYSISIKTTWFI